MNHHNYHLTLFLGCPIASSLGLLPRGKETGFKAKGVPSFDYLQYVKTRSRKGLGMKLHISHLLTQLNLSTQAYIYSEH